jgi:hypothetical protein
MEKNDKYIIILIIFLDYYRERYSDILHRIVTIIAFYLEFSNLASIYCSLAVFLGCCVVRPSYTRLTHPRDNVKYSQHFVSFYVCSGTCEFRPVDYK